jgi:hypothetical protein
MRTWLARLPHSLQEQTLHTSAIQESHLVKQANWHVRFRFERIVNWHNACLAALLQPVDTDAEKSLCEIAQARAALSGEFELTFGLKPPDALAPHITLCRFGDREAAHMVTPHTEALNEHVYQHSGQIQIVFNSISL